MNRYSFDDWKTKLLDMIVAKFNNIFDVQNAYLSEDGQRVIIECNDSIKVAVTIEEIE